MNKWYNSNERFKIKPASRILTHTGVSHKNCCVCKKPFKISETMFPYDVDYNDVDYNDDDGNISINVDNLAHKTCLKNMEKRNDWIV